MPGAGNSNNQINYAYTDQTPVAGLIYYRLKQTDFDGAISYSSQIAVNCESLNNNNVMVYPNPFTDKLNIRYNGIASGNITYCIYNSLGSKVLCGEFTENALKNNDMSLDLQQLKDGVYHLQLIVNGKIINTKIVK